MKIYDDIEALKRLTNDTDKAERILSEKIKLMLHHIPLSFSSAIVTGILLFVMMFTTLDLSPQQKILNISWVIYHTLVIALTWYWWRTIFKNPYDLSITFIKKIFLNIGVFLVIIDAVTLTVFIGSWYMKPDSIDINLARMLWLVFLFFHINCIFLCWNSWQTSKRLASSCGAQNPLSSHATFRPQSASKRQQSYSSVQDKHKASYLNNYVAYRILLMCSLSVGCLWAIFILKMVTTNIQHTTQVIVLIGLHFGLLAGAMSSIGIFWRVYIALALPSMLAWVLALFFIDEVRLVILAVAIFMLLVANILFARNSWLNSIQTVLIYLENVELVSQLRVKSKQLESASLAKTQFLAAASHDLRQPVHALSLFLESLASTELNAQQKQIVDYAKTASQSSREMLNVILDYAHLESGEMTPHIVPTDLNHVIQNLVDEFGMQAQKKNLSLRYRPSTWCVMTDATMLSLILRNFLSNAIRYTSQGGVLIGVRMQSKSNEAIALDYCRVSIWDTGSGIKATEMAQIFESFHQLEHNNQNNQGLGLGLSIAQGMAKLLHAPITVKSTLGSGSQFAVDLPICNNRYEGEVKNNSKQTDHLLGKTVLVVDDEENVLQSMRFLLEVWQCNVVTAFTLHEAVTAFKEHQPQIVITDFRLAQSETGEDVILAINALKGNASLRFVILTGNTAPELMSTPSQINPTILHKPIAPKKLRLSLQKLAKALSEHSDQRLE